ncbi:MAG: SMI1/KNR4 family protein [Acidobacteria bacterium]|nr:SMI1/KNR4 family protein [Acidobacteriota bacterium]
MIDSKDITFQGTEPPDEEILGKLPEELRSLLRQINGFIAFDGGLHIRGAVASPAWHSLRKVWFGDFALSELFSSLKETDVPFGQDCLGDQFVLRDGRVRRLSAETDELEDTGLTLNDFLTEAARDPIGFLSLEPLVRFRSEGGKIENGRLLNVYPPFCTKESADGISMASVPMFERIGFLADFSRRIKNI